MNWSSSIAGPGRPFEVGARLGVVDLGVQLLDAPAVLGHRLRVEHRSGRCRPVRACDRSPGRWRRSPRRGCRRAGRGSADRRSGAPTAERPATLTVHTRPSRRRSACLLWSSRCHCRPGDPCRGAAPRRRPRRAARRPARRRRARRARRGRRPARPAPSRATARHRSPISATHRRFEVGDGEVEVAHRPRREGERAVGRPEAGHAEAHHHRQVGVRLRAARTPRGRRRRRRAGGRPRRRRASSPTSCSTTAPCSSPAARRHASAARAVGLSPAAPASAATAATKPAAGSATVVESAISRTSGSSSSARPCSHRIEISWAPYQPRASASPTSRPSS